MAKLLTAKDIDTAEFHTRLFGYSTDEVDQLLDDASHTILTMFIVNRDLSTENEQLRKELACKRQAE